MPSMPGELLLGCPQRLIYASAPFLVCLPSADPAILRVRPQTLVRMVSMLES